MLPRETGEAQLAIVGKGDKPRNVLLPAEIATALAEMSGNALPEARMFQISERRINYIVKAAAKRAGSIPRPRRTGCGTLTPATRSTAAHRSRSCRRPSGMRT